MAARRRAGVSSALTAFSVTSRACLRSSSRLALAFSKPQLSLSIGGLLLLLGSDLLFLGFDLLLGRLVLVPMRETHHRQGLGILPRLGVDLAQDLVGLGHVVLGQGQAEQHDPRGVAFFLGGPVLDLEDRLGGLRRPWRAVRPWLFSPPRCLPPPPGTGSTARSAGTRRPPERPWFAGTPASSRPSWPWQWLPRIFRLLVKLQGQVVVAGDERILHGGQTLFIGLGVVAAMAFS